MRIVPGEGSEYILVVQEARSGPEYDFVWQVAERRGPCRSLAAIWDVGTLSSGAFAPMQLGEEMRAADVFLFPSVIEGHPQVLGQAAACGLPCIAMNVYRPDFVVDGETSFWSRRRRKLSEKLQVLLTQEELRGSMSRPRCGTREVDWTM